VALERGVEARLTGGELLWHVSQNPMNSIQCEEWPKEVVNKRLPRFTRRDVSTLRVGSVRQCQGYNGNRTATRRNVPGSRLFTTRFGRFAFFDGIHCVPEPHRKAAPLQVKSSL
jgi:hypothetical protein